MEGIDPGRRRSWGKRVQKDVENPSKKNGFAGKMIDK
jgi:hypothetical protein